MQGSHVIWYFIFPDFSGHSRSPNIAKFSYPFPCLPTLSSSMIKALDHLRNELPRNPHPYFLQIVYNSIEIHIITVTLLERRAIKGCCGVSGLCPGTAIKTWILSRNSCRPGGQCGGSACQWGRGVWVA